MINSNFKVIGQWWDKFIYRDGREVISSINHNTFCIGGSLLITDFLLGKGTYTAGLTKLDVGSGNGTDTYVPTGNETALFNSVFSVTLSLKEWVDESGVISLTPTRRAKVMGLIDFGDCVGETIREMGLLGNSDDSILVNYIYHAPIYKDDSFKMERNIILNFPPFS